MDPRVIARVLADIAETASETLELQDVIDRVATSARELIPFDNIGVVRALEGERAVVHATTVRKEGCEARHWEPHLLSAWSPRLRPRAGPIRRMDDAETELDPAFAVDAEILAGGVKSSLWEPFGPTGTFNGGVWLASNERHAFTDEHQQALRPIAALLGSAVEHWRIWDRERRRRQRLDQLELLAEPLAESLDVRDIFAQVSETMAPILPHDLLVLSELDEGARTFTLTAYAGDSDSPPPQGPVALTEQESRRRLLDFEIVRDTREELSPDTERNRVLLGTGMRSWLRVPVLLSGEVRGALGFLHREASRYSEEDVEVARRLADRIALALSHRRLAEEARIAAEERERAARLEATVETLTRELEARGQSRIVGRSRPWKEVLEQVGRVAASETTVLLVGETGTGKELASRLIHQGSPRSGRPFVAINCAALPEQLLESELFGHEKGAFTGAIATKIGRLEQAAGGTLFLDEIGEMSPLVQAKLLRVLEMREFQRVGGTRPLRADVRLVAATNRDLPQAMAKGEFREDLYYRLNVFEILLPPLRERPEDILLLAEAFLEELAPTMARPAAGIARDARDWLLAHPWPGNVRELRNAIERALLLCDGGLITRHHLPTALGRPEEARVAAAELSLDPDSPLPAGGVNLEEVDRGFIEKALAASRGNKTRAARLLGLTRSQLYSRLDKYGLR